MFKSKLLSILYIICFLTFSSSIYAAEDAKPEPNEKVKTEESVEQNSEEKKEDKTEEEHSSEESEEDEDEEPDCD